MSTEQACSLLKRRIKDWDTDRRPTNIDPFYGTRTIAELLLMNAQFDDFTRLTQDFEAEQMCEIYTEISCWDMTTREQRERLFYDFSCLASSISTQQIFELISKDYKGPNITCCLLEKIQAEEYEALTEFHNSLQDAPSTNTLLTIDVAYRCFSILCSNLVNTVADPKLIETAEAKEQVGKSLQEMWHLAEFILHAEPLPVHYVTNVPRQLDNLTSLAFKGETSRRLVEDFFGNLNSDLFISLKNVSSAGHFLETLAFYFSLLGRQMVGEEAK